MSAGAGLATVFAALAALAAVLTLLRGWRGAAREEALRLKLDQLLAGQQSAAETIGLRLRETERALTAPLGDLRAVLGQSQGDLRTALAEGQDKTWRLMSEKLQELREGNEKKLGEIQASVNEQLHAAVEAQMTVSFARVTEQFAAVQKAIGDVQSVTAQIGDLRRLFSNVKARGGWGETQLRAMLDDILPEGGYETNVRMRDDSQEAVEFAVVMPMRGDVRPLLPIDAKFPTEDYERLLAAAEVGDAEGERAARQGLAQRIRKEAEKIRDKYIVPPRSVEFAVLYLPSDGLFAEIARIPGLIDEISRLTRVVILGPSLLPALLRTILLGHVTLALEQKADEVRHLLAATRGEMVRMDAVLQRLAKQASAMGNTIDDARRRTRAVDRKLKGVEVLAPEAAREVLGIEDSVEAEEG
uniref:DNA recombination protein RmuC homolog n=1 Tax=Acidicaldus sp. TaxID=1872105 RepID=A0A8J4M7I0_9PROT